MPNVEKNDLRILFFVLYDLQLHLQICKMVRGRGGGVYISLLACRNYIFFIKMNRRSVENLDENLLQLTIFKLPQNFDKCFKIPI